MKIELELTPAEVDQLREIMDSIPLKRGPMLICKVLKALPMNKPNPSLELFV
jgi:hypothetical protein